jgi:hypothetical protein
MNFPLVPSEMYSVLWADFCETHNALRPYIQIRYAEFNLNRSVSVKVRTEIHLLH